MALALCVSVPATADTTLTILICHRTSAKLVSIRVQLAVEQSISALRVMSTALIPTFKTMGSVFLNVRQSILV